MGRPNGYVAAETKSLVVCAVQTIIEEGILEMDGVTDAEIERYPNMLEDVNSVKEASIQGFRLLRCPRNFQQPCWMDIDTWQRDEEYQDKLKDSILQVRVGSSRSSF